MYLTLFHLFNSLPLGLNGKAGEVVCAVGMKKAGKEPHHEVDPLYPLSWSVCFRHFYISTPLVVELSLYGWFFIMLFTAGYAKLNFPCLLSSYSHSQLS